jgi:hypothetical protein
MGCQHLDEYYELCLIGTLTGEACTIIREHVADQCPYCLTHLRAAARTVYMLCQPTRTVRPDPKRRAQLLHRLQKK